MYTDPISDLLTRIRNANNAKHSKIALPYSKIKENILIVMKKYGFIEDFSTIDKTPSKELHVKLSEKRRDLTLTRLSKPGQRIYVKAEQLKTVRNGLGIQILSTQKGIISNVEARKANTGGELICEIY